MLAPITAVIKQPKIMTRGSISRIRFSLLDEKERQTDKQQFLHLTESLLPSIESEDELESSVSAPFLIGLEPPESCRDDEIVGAIT
jgi:hypothetical protein